MLCSSKIYVRCESGCFLANPIDSAGKSSIPIKDMADATVLRQRIETETEEIALATIVLYTKCSSDALFA